MSAMTESMSTPPRYIAWGLTTITVGLAVMAWGQGLRWEFGNLSTYQIFPIFGLIAFSVMWSQLVAGALQKVLNIDAAELKNYFEVTGWTVLTAIVMHPGLLWWQLWRDGFGLPPESYLQHYVAPSLRWAALLGTVSLFIFLAYELRRRYGKRPWWLYMRYLTDAAMVAIFIHGLKLGMQTQAGWFHTVWIFYGVTLIGLLAYSYGQGYIKWRHAFRT